MCLTISEHPIRFDQVSPFVRHVQLLHIRPGDYPIFTCSYDCRLFYVFRGKGTIYVGEEEHTVSYSDFVFWQSGVKYRMDTAEDEMQFLCINFDLTHDYSHLDYPIPPVRYDLYKEEDGIPNLVISDTPGLNAPVYLTNMNVVEDKLQEMRNEYSIREIHWNRKVNSLLVSILCEAARRSVQSSKANVHAYARVLPVIRYIQEHYAESINNRTLGDKFNYHPNYLNRSMVMSTGMTLYQYLLSCRIQRAIDLLESTNLTISEIATKTGFSDISHFSKLFKRKTGSNPRRYRHPR